MRAGTRRCDWRRGWDSHPITSCSFCNLQKPHCRDCHECRRCPGALHPVAPEHAQGKRSAPPTPTTEPLDRLERCASQSARLRVPLQRRRSRRRGRTSASGSSWPSYQRAAPSRRHVRQWPPRDRSCRHPTRSAHAPTGRSMPNATMDRPLLALSARPAASTRRSREEECAKAQSSRRDECEHAQHLGRPPDTARGNVEDQGRAKQAPGDSDHSTRARA
jgi:hypothetical protein